MIRSPLAAIVGALVAAIAVLPGPCFPEGTPFSRGDSNGDGSLDVSDAVRILLHLFAGSPAPEPLDSSDADDSGAIDLSDALRLLLHIFGSGPPPAAPFPEPGLDPTPDDPFTEGDEPDPRFPLPDLAPKSLSFDTEGQLTVTFANEGEGQAPAGKGGLAVFVDGRRMFRERLADLADQSFRSPGGLSTVLTGIRAAGSNRRIALFVDPEGEIRESNEFQNTLSRTLTPPARMGPDLTVADLSLGPAEELSIVLRNAGTSDSPTGLEVRLALTAGSSAPESVSTILPSLAAGGGETAVIPSPPIAVPPGTRVLVELEPVPGEIDTTNNLREEVLPGGPSLEAYRALLEEPRIQDAIVWEDRGGAASYARWEALRRSELERTILELERGDPYPFAAPPLLNPDNSISPLDAWKIFRAHVAQSLRVEVHRIVTWRLLDLSDEDLPYLLDCRKLFSFNSSSGTYRFDLSLLGNVTAWNPRIAFEFLSSLGMVRRSQIETIEALTGWMRAHLIHTAGSDDFNQLFGYPGPPPVDKVLYSLEGRRHKTAGCWGTTGLHAAVLRTVNIPVRSERILLGTGTHSRPEFPTVSRSMSHGDDPYTTILTPSGAVIPTSKLFFSLEEMQARFLDPPVDCIDGRCNTPGDQAQYNAGKAHWQTAFDHRGDYLLYEYVIYGPAYLDDSLRGPRIGGGVKEFAKPYFDEAERAAMLDAAARRIEELGGGDLEAGKRKVIQRYGRFGANK